MEQVPPALGAQTLNHWTLGKSVVVFDAAVIITVSDIITVSGVMDNEAPTCGHVKQTLGQPGVLRTQQVQRP